MNLALIYLFLFNFSWAKPITINVGGYDFPPFVINTSNGGYEGLTLDLISLLNQKQSKYEFRFVPTSTSRRYSDLEEGKYQIIAFENKAWGWDPHIVDASKVFHTGGEVFVTLNDGKKTQSYFKDLKNKKIKGIRGYHYGFLGLSTGAKAMKDFNLELTNTHDGNLISVANKRADIAITSKEYLDFFVTKHPEYKDKFYISKDYDQVYQLSFLVNKKQKNITAEDLNKLIDEIQKDNSWAEVLKTNGIEISHHQTESKPNPQQ